MTFNPRLLLVVSAMLAASGQIFFKLGAAGATGLLDYLNVRLVSGLFLYALSTLLWILALTQLPLSKAYPFTVLTFILVYAGSAVFLGEQITVGLVIGALLVL